MNSPKHSDIVNVRILATFVDIRYEQAGESSLNVKYRGGARPHAQVPKEKLYNVENV